MLEVGRYDTSSCVGIKIASKIFYAAYIDVIEEYAGREEQINAEEDNDDNEDDIEGRVNERSGVEAPVRKSPRFKSKRAYHTTISQYKQHRRFLKLLHEAAPKKMTRRRRKNGEIVMLSKPKLDRQYKGIPRSVNEAMRSEHKQQWSEAKEAEDNSLKANDVWKRVEKDQIPQGVKIIHGKYIFDIRRHADGSIKKFKVRLVARGDLQDPSTYGDTYAGTANRKAVMMLLNLANYYQWETSSCDISTALLHGDLEESVYMKHPDGEVAGRRWRRRRSPGEVKDR